MVLRFSNRVVSVNGTKVCVNAGPVGGAVGFDL